MINTSNMIVKNDTGVLSQKDLAEDQILDELLDDEESLEDKGEDDLFDGRGTINEEFPSKT